MLSHPAHPHFWLPIFALKSVSKVRSRFSSIKNILSEVVTLAFQQTAFLMVKLIFTEVNFRLNVLGPVGFLCLIVLILTGDICLHRIKPTIITDLLLLCLLPVPLALHHQLAYLHLEHIPKDIVC